MIVRFDNYSYKCFKITVLLPVVTVSLPTTLSVTEGDGMVEVCVSLSGATENTQRDFTVTLTTSDDSGIFPVSILIE